ncbi:hypothetical protein JOQ06_014594 [Pogonophryne albipinna]|uniref:Calcium-binding and coiled-coil domain-containing protein 1 n=1 Tax=Pogonophryne albipinna TaxID=1090488 RepID=A0AAD6F9M9_9TELE|nr:hypothetical protein JOQ06_014594 [Pogonophryne albipinna]
MLCLGVVVRLIQSSILQEATAGHHINFSAEYAQLPITMEKQPTVVFHNVGQVYFPQSRVECHYSLTSDHRWSSSDWIGIFEMGCTSRKQYHTYTWALVPEGYTEGTSVNCCALFHASYLPRPSAAQLLQSQLDESLKKQADIHLALDVAKEEAEKQKEDSRKARVAWELEREAMKQEISELRANMKHNCEILKKIEGNHKNVKYSQENLTSELSKLMVEKDESEQRIQELEEDIKVLNDREKEENSELERLKERVKKMSSQMKHDEEKRKCLQREYEAALVEVRGLQDRLEASEHVAESLRRELRELGIRQGHTNTELHQARLQVAQLTLLLSEENLVLREERANWTLEREAYKHAAEVMQSDSKRELQELKVGLRAAQKEREEQQAEKQELLIYILQLEQRLEVETESKDEVPTSLSPGSSSEDEENVSSASSRSILSHLFLSTPLERPHRAETPAAETPVSDTQHLLPLSLCSEVVGSPMW